MSKITWNPGPGPGMKTAHYKGLALKVWSGGIMGWYWEAGEKSGRSNSERAAKLAARKEADKA